MAAILNFRIFRQIIKHKNAYISKTVLDRAISTKFLTHRVSLQSSHANFQKKNFSQKMAAILNFRIFRQIIKHKNAYISKTVLDRAISTKFLTHRVSLQSSHANFQKKNFSQKMAAILNFRSFRKIAKHKNASISKTVLDRAISTKFLTHSFYRVAMPIFKESCLAKNGGHFEISNFCAKIAKHKNANISNSMLHRTISTKFLIFRVSLQSSYRKELSLGEVSDP